jgi:hypothetical protein
MHVLHACPMTSQADACSYCMGFVVLILSRINLYLQLWFLQYKIFIIDIYELIPVQDGKKMPMRRTKEV